MYVVGAGLGCMGNGTMVEGMLWNTRNKCIEQLYVSQFFKQINNFRK